MTETEKLKAQIQELQEKLQKLEEQDPEMLLLRQGKVDVVDYDGKKYFRIEYTDSFAGQCSWYVRRIGEDAVRPVRDVNVYDPLEELYQKEVVKQKDDYTYKKYTPEEQVSFVPKEIKELVREGEEAQVKTAQERGERLHKDVERVVKENMKWFEEHPDESVEDWLKPQTPEQVADGLKEAFREAVKQGVVSSHNKPKTLSDLIYDWWGDVFTTHSDWDMETSIENLVDEISLWLPTEHDTNSYKWNQCIRTIREKLR